MDGRHATWRRGAAALLMAVGLAAAVSVQANSYESPYVKGRLVQVDVYDRADGTALPVYAKNGRNFIVGTPGHEYAVRIRNCTGARILVATSVDGVNVISGETAAPSQTGYVLDPWGSVEITGWRKSLDRTAAFYFTDLGDSYAARTGRPLNVGVVGVAVFQEKTPPVVWREFQKRFNNEVPPYPESRPLNAPEAQKRQESAAGTMDRDAGGAAGAPRERADVATSPPVAPSPPVAKDSLESGQKSLGKLGTGHGRSEDSRVTMVAFERATDSPAETVAIQYDRRENLVAMGVLPQPYYARRAQPDPFPAAMRFAPDPK